MGDRHPVGRGEVDDVGDAVVAVGPQLGRQPDLVDLAALGDQQLAHGLAALDLLAAEPLAAGWPGAGRRLAADRRRCARRPACCGAGLRGAGERRGVERAPPRGRRLRRGHRRRPRPAAALRPPDRARRPARPAALARRTAAPTAGRPPRSGPTRPPRAAARRRAPRAALTAHLGSSTTAAKQAMPSPRPSAPRPSGRRPFTDTGAPTAAPSRACISSRRAPVWGARRPPSNRRCRSTSPSAGHVGDDVAQQHDRVGARQRRVGVGEVLADVAEPGGAEQRVGDGVGDRVGVAVADEARARRGTGSRRAPAAGRVVTEPVDVEALTDSDLESLTRRLAPASQRAGPLEVVGLGDLAVAGLAGHDDDPAADRLDQRGVVGALAAGAWARRSTSARKACGVCTATSVARSGVATTTPSASTTLIVSVTGTPGTAPSAPSRTAAIDAPRTAPPRRADERRRGRR